MESIEEILKKKTHIANNDNINIKPNNGINDNNDSNDAIKSKFALNKSQFTPNTEESILAEEISLFFKDLQNYAFYFKVVNTLGTSEGWRFFITIQRDIKEKSVTKYPVRNDRKYFTWKYKNRKKFGFK